MPELHPGPEVSLGMLEAQLRKIGLHYNVGYFLTVIDGHWALSLSEENYQRWQDAYGSAEPAETAPAAPAAPAETGESSEDDGDSDPPPQGAENTDDAKPASRRAAAKKGR